MRLRQHDIAVQEIDGQAILLDLRSSVYLSTNGLGAFVLRLLAEERTREQLLAAVLETFAVPADRAGRDLDAFLSSLRQHRLLDEGQSPS